MAGARKETEEARPGREVLVFTLGREEFGLDIACVREVLRPLEIHPLPQTSSLVAGVVNLREHIIAVIDLNKKFGVPSEKEMPRRRIIVCKMRKIIVGLIVDSITEIVRVFDENFDATPDILPVPSEDSCLLGVVRLEKRVITVLDLEKLLTHEEAQKLLEVRKS